MALVISDVLFLIARSVGWWVKYGCASSNTSKATVVEQFQKKHEIVGLTLVRENGANGSLYLLKNEKG